MKVVLLFFGFVAFIKADVDDTCGFAPLCGQEDTEFDWQEGLVPDGVSGDVLFGAELNFEDCCKLTDTEPVESCQIVDPTGESYRATYSSDSLCGPSGVDCPGDCNEYQLVINPTFIHSSNNDACCDSCSCFGDPQCISFAGEENIWVLCDGREIPREESIWEMCRITRNQCEEETDHAGNQCHYLAEDNRGRDWIVGRQGSPCVPDPESPPSTILMYYVQNPLFNMTLEQGERGIIKRVMLTIECGYFELEAENCMADGEDAWTFEGVDNLPEFFSYNDVVRGFDQHWSIVDPDSGIAIQIRCHANHFEGDSTAYVPRINVEDISDPLPRQQNDGYCVTGDFEFGQATTSNTEKIESDEVCTQGLQDSDVRQIFRAMCKNPGLPSSAHESCIYHFCSERHRPLFDTIAACENKFEESLAEGFCMGVTYTVADANKCVDQWFDLGAVETIQQYYDDESGCTTEIQTSLNKCQSGIEIQYYRNDQWNTQVAIPSNFCPDAGSIVLSYCDNQYLFNRQIRILQKTAATVCGPVNQCQTVEGLEFSVGLVKETPFPTVYPSESPTTEPSPYPTPFPVPPTSVPTPFPDSPTLSPVPGEFPTPCPVTPLCGTEYEEVEYDDDGIYIEMEECCPVDTCPGEEYTRNRTKGTDTWYCGVSDGFGGTVEDSELGMECEDDYELTINIDFYHEEECCLKCTCFGDPRCYSFDGVFEEFILCDGRTPGDSAEDRCVIRRDTCLAQDDHEGNQCSWENPNRDPPDFNDAERQEREERQYQVSRWGSPCRYDQSESGVAMVLMYETSDYILEVEQGERGYIQSVHLTVGNNRFQISAERCLDGDDWEIVEGSTDDMYFGRQAYGREYLWEVQDFRTQIELRIRCTGHLYNNRYATKFINVEALLEPDDERVESAEGFCATSQMPEKELASTDYTESLRDNGLCDNWNEDATDVMKREVARIITNNPGVTNQGVETAYRSFCSNFFSPGWNSVGNCVDAFMDSKNAQEMIEVFCKATTSERNVCEEQLEIIAGEDGYKRAFSQGYDQYVINYEMQCQVKFGDVPETLALEECQTGVELQWWNPRRNLWVTYAAFPDGGPCSGYTVKARYDYHPKLFKNPLRVVQVHPFGKCSACTYVSEVTAWFRFSQEPSSTF